MQSKKFIFKPGTKATINRVLSNRNFLNHSPLVQLIELTPNHENSNQVILEKGAEMRVETIHQKQKKWIASLLRIEDISLISEEFNSEKKKWIQEFSILTKSMRYRLLVAIDEQNL